MTGVTAASGWGPKAFPDVVPVVEFPRKLTQQVTASHGVMVMAAEKLMELNLDSLADSMKTRRGFHLDVKV